VSTFDLKKFLVENKLTFNSQREGEKEETDQIDEITVDVPLMIRLLEYAREDANSDVDLHNVAERLTTRSKEKGKLSMEDYDTLVN